MDNSNRVETINDINDYIIKINKIPLPKDSLISKSIKLFRGYPDFEYKNIPSIGRSINKNIHNTPLIYEEMTINKAKLKMPELFASDIFPIQTITKLQHYGLPTRILDFTTNALVALYFACQSKTENKQRKDGKVLICYENEEDLYTCYSPFVNAIADMNYVSRYTFYDFNEFIKYLETKTYWKFTNYDLVNTDKVRERISVPIFFEPESNSERIKRQQGIFLIFPNAIEKSYDDTLNINQDLATWEPKNFLELIIPSEFKNKILRGLVELGITKSFLFPEPENICKDIFNDVKARFNT